jgi:hypothetical protein
MEPDNPSDDQGGADQLQPQERPDFVVFKSKEDLCQEFKLRMLAQLPMFGETQTLSYLQKVISGEIKPYKYSEDEPQVLPTKEMSREGVPWDTLRASPSLTHYFPVSEMGLNISGNHGGNTQHQPQRARKP